jgi:D-alanine-D-alanine ligase
VKFAHSSEELPPAIVGALSYDRKVVLERYISGRDLAVSVLDADTPPDGPPGAPRAAGSPTGQVRAAGSLAGEARPPRAAPVALPVVEASPREREFYDYESRYEIGMTTYVCPAELPPEATARAQELALATYALLGCHGVARIDLMLGEDGELTVLEANVVPGLTVTIMLPIASDAAGIDLYALVGRILQSAFTRGSFGS